MNRWQQMRRIFVALMAVFLLTTSVACSTATPEARTTTSPNLTSQSSGQYSDLARGDTAQGDQYADWVIQTSHGLIKDAYVRDNDKLGVVISKDVRPDDVKPLARSLVQGFRRSAPDRNLNVLVYAPDKQLILTARYDSQTKQVNYQG